jgi:hypothetical protein
MDVSMHTHGWLKVAKQLEPLNLNDSVIILIGGDFDWIQFYSQVTNTHDLAYGEII